MSKKKKILMSHSAAQSWKTCPELHYLKHIARVSPKHQGASLAFGIAVDIALCYLLERKKEGKEDIGKSYYKNIFVQDAKRGWDLSFDSEILRYRKADYDANMLLDESDTIKKWEKELNTTESRALQAERQKDHKKMSTNDLKMFNRLCWLSLKHKGLLMLDAFEKQVLPKIKKVIAVQFKITGEVNGVARVGGYIDLICEYEGKDLYGNKINAPVVFDIKTSSSYYDNNRIMFSEQLHLYLNAVGEGLKTDYVGFLVLLKFPKIKYICSKCGFIKESRHKTCNNEIDGKRCNAKWGKKLEGQVQELVDIIPKERQKDFLDSFSELAVLMSQGKRVKNYDACFKYGMCDFFHLCHYGDKSKYEFPKEKTKKEENK